MTLTIATVRRARPGKTEALVQAAFRRCAERRRLPSASRQIRLFQGVEPPGLVLYLAEWERPAAFWEALATHPPDELDALAVAAPRRYMLESLRFTEHAGRRAGALACSMMYDVPAAAEAIAAFNRQVVEQLLDEPGFVFRHAYRCLGHPHRLFAVDGWETEMALAQFVATHPPRPAALLGQHGVHTKRFVGLT